MHERPFPAWQRQARLFRVDSPWFPLCFRMDRVSPRGSPRLFALPGSATGGKLAIPFGAPSAPRKAHSRRALRNAHAGHEQKRKPLRGSAREFIHPTHEPDADEVGFAAALTSASNLAHVPGCTMRRISSKPRCAACARARCTALRSVSRSRARRSALRLLDSRPFP